jgi:hypothetical protein
LLILSKFWIVGVNSILKRAVSTWE